MSSLAVILAAAVVCAPVSSSVTNTDFKTVVSKVDFKSTILIAQKYGGSNPHGEDPHGDDPHEEQHDSSMPANQDKTGKAPKDVYGGNYPNTQAPY